MSNVMDSVAILSMVDRLYGKKAIQIRTYNKLEKDSFRIRFKTLRNQT